MDRRVERWEREGRKSGWKDRVNEGKKEVSVTSKEKRKKEGEEK